MGFSGVHILAIKSIIVVYSLGFFLETVGGVSMSVFTRH